MELLFQGVVFIYALIFLYNFNGRLKVFIVGDSSILLGSLLEVRHTTKIIQK